MIGLVQVCWVQECRTCRVAHLFSHLGTSATVNDVGQWAMQQVVLC
jgi:hypothetical protein